MAFSYSSAINNLVAGAAENVADLVTLYGDIKAVLNNGITGVDHLSPTAGITGSQLSATAGITDTQLASPNSATYRTIGQAGLETSGSPLSSGTTYQLSSVSSVPVGITAGCDGDFYFDPADYAVTGRTTKYRLRVVLYTNATAPTSTFTVGLYPVTACAGGAGLHTQTVGAVTAGSTLAFAAPAASTQFQGSSGDFTAPVAGYYVVAVAVTVANMPANSSVFMRGLLQARNV